MVSNSLWLKSGKDPKTVFMYLTEAGAKLDDITVVTRWLKYVDAYRIKTRYSQFPEYDIFRVLRTSRPESELVTLLERLRQVPGRKSLAETMQRFLSMASAPSQKLMNDAWLKSRQTPEDVFRILRLKQTSLDDDVLLWRHWIRYTKADGTKMPYSDSQAIRFLLRERPFTNEPKLAALVQSMKEIPDLKKSAKNMQNYMFLRWQKIRLTPKTIIEVLTLPYSNL